MIKGSRFSKRTYGTLNTLTRPSLQLISLCSSCPPEDRLNCLNNIHNGLRSNGVFLISEKIDDDEEFDELHVDFKRENGYSELEINQKREALENVMKIDSREAILARLKHAGFTHCRIWFRCLNWISILASP